MAGLLEWFTGWVGEVSERATVEETRRECMALGLGPKTTVLVVEETRRELRAGVR